MNEFFIIKDILDIIDESKDIKWYELGKKRRLNNELNKLRSEITLARPEEVFKLYYSFVFSYLDNSDDWNTARTNICNRTSCFNRISFSQYVVSVYVSDSEVISYQPAIDEFCIRTDTINAYVNCNDMPHNRLVRNVYNKLSNEAKSIIIESLFTLISYLGKEKQ